MLANINPDMLILGRESRGISQSELAGLIGISQGKLSKAEKGEQSLPVEALEKLYKQLKYPIKFFFQETPSAPVSHYYYRKKITIPQKTIIQMEASIKIFRKNIDSLLDAIELPDFKFPNYDSLEDTPEVLANKVRHFLNITKGPINNLTNLLENNGIIIVKTDLFNEKIDGLSTISEKGAHIIYLNSRMPNDRQRFSLAHELGHILMHFDIPSSQNNVEDEANRFASELLMPKSEIINSIRYLTFPKLGEIKRYWKVSMKSIVYRAHFLGTITQSQYRNFQINFSRKKMTKSEPIILPEEQPFILNEIIKLHREELGYSNDELARILHLDISEFEDRFLFSNRPKLRVIRNVI
jgi:Zn-dependent peptidase ImmA (M78 family)